MASISNQFISYADRWFFSRSFGKDDISRIDKTLLNTQESEQSKIDKILDSMRILHSMNIKEQALIQGQTTRFKARVLLLIK